MNAVETCRYCPAVVPADWDVQNWHELPERGNVTEAMCCDACYWAEVYSGPLQDDGEPFGPTTEQRMALARLKR